jgi:hypothetical protein
MHFHRIVHAANKVCAALFVMVTYYTVPLFKFLYNMQTACAIYYVTAELKCTHTC